LHSYRGSGSVSLAQLYRQRQPAESETVQEITGAVRWKGPRATARTVVSLSCAQLRQPEGKQAIVAPPLPGGDGQAFPLARASGSTSDLLQKVGNRLIFAQLMLSKQAMLPVPPPLPSGKGQVQVSTCTVVSLDTPSAFQVFREFLQATRRFGSVRFGCLFTRVELAFQRLQQAWPLFRPEFTTVGGYEIYPVYRTGERKDVRDSEIMFGLGILELAQGFQTVPI
jgi:hypothetical protein